MDPAQPSSRDASDEGAEDPVLQRVASKKERQADVHTPVKRTRSVKSGVDGDNDAEPDEADRAAKKTKREGSDGDHGENGEAGTMRMSEPPKAGLVDPVVTRPTRRPRDAP